MGRSKEEVVSADPVPSEPIPTTKVAIDDGEQKVGEVESDVPEVNIDEERRRREEREQEDKSPQALRRRMAAEAALRRLSSSESIDSSQTDTARQSTQDTNSNDNKKSE